MDPFLRRVEASGRKWVVIVTPGGEPLHVLDADGFLRAVFFGQAPVRVTDFCHAPIVVKDRSTRLEEVLPQLRLDRQHAGDDVIDKDLVLVWGEERRIITGADLLGRLLRGIAKPDIGPSPAR
jgi:hypothetical protein